MPQKTFTLGTLAGHLGIECRGNPEITLSGIAPLHSARPGQLSFLDNPKYKSYLATTQASAVIVSPNDAADCPTNALVADNPYFTYAIAAQAFEEKPHFAAGQHASVVVGADCQIAASAHIGARVVIGNHVCIGEHAIIEPGCVLADHTSVGAHVHLHPNVVLYARTQVGAYSIIHSSAVLGSDGFGFAKHKGQWHKVPQLGRVIVGEHVEIGACTTVDRGALGDTVIRDYAKLDNQIQIGHNVVIGERTAMAGCSAIAGSTEIGKDCLIGGGSRILGHIKICDNVAVTGASNIGKSIDVAGVYSSGIPAVADKAWKRILARLMRLDNLADRIRHLEKTVKSLVVTED